jgi:hypothetical protein
LNQLGLWDHNSEKVTGVTRGSAIESLVFGEGLFKDEKSEKNLRYGGHTGSERWYL